MTTDELIIDVDLDVSAPPADDSGILDLRALLAEQRAAEAAGESRPLVAIAPPLVSERPLRPRPASFVAWAASVAVFALSAIVYASAATRVAPVTEGASTAPAKHELSAGGLVPLPKPAAPVALLAPEPALDPAPTPPTEARSARRPAAPPPSAAPASPPPSAAGAPAHSWSAGSADGVEELDPSIDALLDRAVGERAGADPLRATLPPTPTRRQVSATLRALEGEVRLCADSGVARVRLVVEGATGRVDGVTVSGALAGTEAAACVARAVRSARFPRFERERFVIEYPYVL